MRKSVCALLLGLGLLSTTLVSYGRDWPYSYGNDNVDRYKMGGASYRAENGFANDALYRMNRERQPLKIRHFRQRAVLKEPSHMDKAREKASLASERRMEKSILTAPPKKGQNSFLQF
jgi:hypothetical protein